MQTSWHDTLGSGHGLVSRLAPQVRLMAGVGLFSACMVAPTATMPGVAIVTATTLSWVIACGSPPRRVRSFALFGLAVFLPYLLLVPLIRSGNCGQPGAWRSAIFPPWGIFLHGMAGMLVSTSTATSLSPSDLRRGMLALPVPGIVSAILLQILHQTSELAYETRRVAAAIAVRGASNGWRTSIRLLSSLPRVWLPRVLVRADRVAAAMELRGYCEVDPRAYGRCSMTGADATVLAVTVGVLALAVVLRRGGIG